MTRFDQDSDNIVGDDFLQTRFVIKTTERKEETNKKKNIIR